MPDFAIDGGLLLVLARGCASAGTLLVFGTLTFGSVVAPRALVRAAADVSGRARRSLLQLARLEVIVCFTSTLTWLVVEARTMADATGWGDTARALGAVGFGTWFGKLVLVSLVASVIALAVLGRGKSVVQWWGATIVSGIGTAVQAGHAHALAMHSGPGLLLLSGVAHLLSAGAWLGGLPPLLLIVHRAPPRTGAAAARWFSPIGKWCVVGIAVSAAFQSWSLIGDMHGLIGTAYGWSALAKIVLFAMLLGFAVINRYRLAPALLTADPTRARRALVCSVAVQTGFGLLTVIAAATLASLPPAIHEQL